MLNNGLINAVIIIILFYTFSIGFTKLIEWLQDRPMKGKHYNDL